MHGAHNASTQEADVEGGEYEAGLGNAVQLPRLLPQHG